MACFIFRSSRTGQRNYLLSESTNTISVCIMNNNNRSVHEINKTGKLCKSDYDQMTSADSTSFSCYKLVEICLLNACSMKNKSFVIKDFVVDENIDVLVVTETWLQADISDQLLNCE